MFYVEHVRIRIRTMNIQTWKYGDVAELMQSSNECCMSGCSYVSCTRMYSFKHFSFVFLTGYGVWCCFCEFGGRIVLFFFSWTCFSLSGTSNLNGFVVLDWWIMTTRTRRLTPFLPTVSVWPFWPYILTHNDKINIVAIWKEIYLHSPWKPRVNRLIQPKTWLSSNYTEIHRIQLQPQMNISLCWTLINMAHTHQIITLN